MKTRVLLVLLISCFVLAHHEKKSAAPRTDHSRAKRSAAGALHIVTNHAQPIHADVKADSEGNEKPCPEGNKPSHIETGVGFQVTPPESDKYEIKSLRKSLHLPQETSETASPLLTTKDLMRKISRSITFTVLLLTVVLEFHTFFGSCLTALYRFVFNQ